MSLSVSVCLSEVILSSLQHSKHLKQDVLRELPGRDQRESQKNLDLDNFSLISSNLGLDNHENCSLGRVSISTILKSESRPDLDLDSLGNISLVPISISTIF